MVYTVFYKTSSFAGYCFLSRYSIHPKRYGVFSFKVFIAVLVKIQICSFIVIINKMGTQHNMLPFVHVGLPFVHRGIEKIKYSVILSTYHGKQIKLPEIVRQLRRG